MRISFLPLVFCAATLAAQDYWCLDRRISISGDYGYIRRAGVRDLRLVQDASVPLVLNGNAKPKKVLDTDHLADRLGWESAIRGTLTLHGSPSSSFELQYTYFYPWSAKQIVKGGILQFPFLELSQTLDYRFASRVVASYTSELQSAEANYWWHVTPQRVNYFSWSWIIGGRIVYLKEDMRLLFFREADRSSYKIATENHLYGPQLGAVLQVNPSDCWTWTFMVKGAGFFNVANNDVDVRDRNNDVQLIEYKKNRWTDSWLIEGYGQLAWNANSFLSVHVGYQAYLLSGIALAPNNRDVHLPQRRRLNMKGQITIDGLYAGLDFSF